MIKYVHNTRKAINTYFLLIKIDLFIFSTIFLINYFIFKAKTKKLRKKYSLLKVIQFFFETFKILFFLD